MPNTLTDWYRSQNPGDNRSDEEITMMYGDQFGPEVISQYPDAFSDYQKLSQQRKINFATPTQEFTTGVKRGVSGLEAAGAGALALTSGLVGAEGAKEFYRDIYRRKAQEAAQTEAAVPAVGDVSGLHTGALYAAGKAGEFLPNIGEAAIFAGLGAMEGAAVGAPEAGIATGAAGLVARNVARRTLARLITKGASEEAVKDVEKFAAGQATRAALSPVARAELMATAQEMGGAAASALNFGAQGAGGAYASALEQPGVTEEKARGAAAIGAVGSGIGALIPARFLHAVLPGVNPDTAKSLINRLAVNVPKEALAAGGAMAAMEIGNIVAERYAKDQDIVAPLSDAEISRVVNAGVPGVALGAITGGVASLRAPEAKPTPETPPTQPPSPGGVAGGPPAGPAGKPPIAPVTPKPAGPNADIVKGYQPWRLEEAKPDELLTARQAIATVAKDNWNPSLVAWYESQPQEKQAWFDAELAKEKANQNAISIGSPKAVPVDETSQGGAGVVGQIRSAEEPALPQAQGQNVPATGSDVGNAGVGVLAPTTPPTPPAGAPLGSEAAITDLRRIANEALHRLNQVRKPTVPGTPAEAERDLTALQEIRLKGLDTKAKIQEAFPHLSKEEAAQFRDAAFPERAAQFAEAERIAALKRQARATAGQTPKPTISPEAAYEKASNDFDESLKVLRKAQIDFKNKELGDAGLLKATNRFRAAQARLAKAKDALPTPPPPLGVIETPEGERVVGKLGETHDEIERRAGVTGSKRFFQEQVGPTAGQNETRAEAAARHTEIPKVEEPATPTKPAQLHVQDVNRTLSQPPPETPIKQPATPETTQTAAETSISKLTDDELKIAYSQNISKILDHGARGEQVPPELQRASGEMIDEINRRGTWASSDVEGFETQLSPEQFFSDALPEPKIQKSTKALTEKEGEAMVGNWSNALESAMDATASKRRVKRSILEPPRPGEPTQEELNKARDAIMGAQSQEAESLEETSSPPVEPTTGKVEPLTEERQRVQIRALIGSDEDGRQKGAALRALADQQGISVKEMQEKVEAEIVRMSHEAAISEHMTPEEQFRWAQALYDRQPTLSARTSTSVANQAYSTPAPLAFALKNALDVKRDKTLYEPTGGNGMLMIGSDLKRSQGNELNKVRANALRKLGVGVVTENDATKYTPSGTFEVVEANPPFGSINNVNYGGYGIKRLEHLIALRALEAMEEKGKGAIILGAKREPTEGGKGAQWVFENYLYGHYNVVGNFEVAGELYAKQGASWPVRVLVVDGKRVEPIGGELAPKSVDRLNSWDDVWKESERIRNEIERRRQTLGSARESGLPVRPPRQPSPTEEPGNVPPAPSRPAEPVVGPSQRGGEIGGERATVQQLSPSEPGPATARPLSKPEDEPPVSPKPSVAGKPSGGVEKRPGGEAKTPENARPGGKAGSGVAEPGIVPRPPTVVGTEHQTPYRPASKGNPFGTLTPKSVASGTFKALGSLTERVGPIDDFVANRLNMTPDEVREVMAAEQIDGVALAIDQIENGGALIIGDETGIGKGRQGAALIRYAALNGKIPIFFTKDPKLFTDMYGDLLDINTHVKPFIMGDPSKASIVDAEGSKIHASPGSARQKTEMARIEELGLNGAGYDSIFATYSQVNTRNARQLFLEKLAENNDTIIILDEAHEAAGDSSSSMQAAFMSGGTVKRGSGPDQQTIVVPGLLRTAGTQKGRGGVLYMSATFAKRADNLPVFFRTSLSKASESFPQIVEAMKRGGVALQQAVSEALAQVGQYIRRERDFSGVSYAMKKVLVKDEAKLIDHVDQITDSLSEIVRFSQELRDKVKGSGTTSTAMSESAIDMTDFAAIVHNQVGQLLLAAKADSVIEEAIAAHKNGEKPIIALMNTMESFLGSYVEDKGLKVGDTTKIRWNELIKHALERSLRTSEDMPDGSTLIGRADPDQYGLGDQYRQILEAADSIESNFPISPIDYIIQKLNKAGIRMVELTGRTSGIEYTDFESGEGIYRKFKKANKNSVVNRFNGGEADGMVMNASGSTGLSAHASEKFKDQKPRHMIIAQPSLDINTFVQTLGRIKRTGMVKNGRDANGQPYGAKYTQTVLPLQAELRPAAMAARKMKSLNANTTAETDNAIKIEAEDLFNKYGDRVVAEYLDENPHLQNSTGLYIDRNTDGSIEVPPDIARRFTGRMAIRPDEEQKTAYDHILPAYRETIEQLKQTGEYDLEVAVHDDWDAKLKSDSELSAGTDESNIFTAGVKVQKWEVKDNRHVPTGAEMVREFKSRLGGEDKLNESWSQTQERASKTLSDRMEAVREEMRAATTDAERNKASQKADTVREMEQRWRNTQDTVDGVIRGAGEVLELVNNETGDTYDGMLVDARLPKSGSMTPRNFRFRFSIDAPGGVLHLTGQDFVGNKWSMSRSSKDVSDLVGKKTGARYDRYFIIGNPIRGYEATGGNGKVVRFKSSDGAVITGLMMPNNWGMEKLAKDPRIDLVSANAAAHFLRENTGRGYYDTGIPIEAANGLVRIGKSRYGSGEYTISVPSAKRTGGDIYLNESVRAITGDFTKVGNRMTVNVDSGKVARAIDAISTITRSRFRPVGKVEDLISLVAESNRRGSIELRHSITASTEPEIERPELQAIVQDVAQTLTKAGWKTYLLKPQAAELVNEFDSALRSLIGRTSGGVVDLNRKMVGVVLRDVTQPSLESMRVIFEEVGHIIMHEWRDMPGGVDLISQLFKNDRGDTAWSRRMTPEDIANIAEAYPNGAPADILTEERFMAVISRKMAESGFNPIQARTQARALYRLAKELYLKALMWVQKTLFGPGYDGQGLAEEFFINRVEKFMARDSETLSWIDRLGGPKPTPELEVTWHHPVNGGDAQSYDTISGRIDQQALVQDSLEAVELNVQDNGLRYSITAPDAPIPPGGFVDPAYKLNQQTSVNNLRDGIHEAIATAKDISAEAFRKLFGIVDTKAVAAKLALKAGDAPNYKADILPENWKSPDNRLKVARQSLETISKEAAKIQARRAEAEARLPIFEAKRNEILDAYGKDLHGEMLDSTKLLAEMRSNIRKLGADLVRKLYDTSRQMGAVEQQISVLEGLKDRQIPASYGPVFQKLFTGDQLNGQKLFDLLSTMANDKSIDFSKPITEIRDTLKQSQFPTYRDMAQDTPEARALLGTVVAYAKTNERMMAKLQVRLMDSGTERAALAQELLDLRKSKPAELQRVISGLSKQAGIAANAKAAYREMLRQAANYAARIEIAKKRIELAEASRPEYQKAMDRFSSMLESHPDFHFVDGATYFVPESHDQPFDRLTKKTLQLNTTKSDVTDPKAIRADMDKMSEWLYAKEQAFKGGDERALNEDYHTVKRMRDELFRELGSFQKFVLASQEWPWLIRILPAGRQIASIGTPSARIFGVLWNRYQDQINSTKQTVERMGYENVHEMRKVLAVLSKDTKDGVAQGWYESNILNPAIEFLEQRGDLLETSVSEEQARDRAYQQLGNYLLGNKFVAPKIKDRMGEFMPALRKHITKLDESSNWWADRLEKAGMGVEDPKLGGKIRRFIKQGIVTVHRTFSDDFKTMAEALRGSGWALFGSELKGVDPETGAPWTIADKYNQDPNSVHQTFAKYTSSPEHGDTIQRIFLSEIANSPKESLIRAPKQADGITQIPADSHLVSEAWATANGDIVTLSENLFDLYGGTGDKGAYVQSVLEDFNRVYSKAVNIDKKVNPGPSPVKIISFKGLIPHAMIDAREIEDLPGIWFRYHTFDRTENTELARRVAAQIEWGRDGERLASALQTVKEETAKDVVRLQAALTQAARVVPSGKQSLIKQEAARLVGGITEFKRLERMQKQAGLPEKVANDVYTFFHLRNDTEGNLRLGIRAAQELAFLMVNQPASAISQLATMFDTNMRLGASPLATKATLDTMGYTAKDLLNSITQSLGFQLFSNSYYEDVYNRLGFSDAEIMRKAGDVFATMEGEGGMTLAAKFAKGVRVAKDIQSFPLNRMGEKAQNTVLRILAPFSTTVLSANRGLTVGNWKLAEKFVSMGVDALKHDPTLSELTPDAIGLKGANKDTFMRWQKDLNSRGLVFTEMVRGAKDRLENGNKTILTDDELLRTYSMAINEISLEASIATMPMAAYNNSFYKFASPLLGWTFRRGVQVLETPFNAKDQLALGSFNRAMLGLASVGLGGLALSLVVDEYQEHLVGKKRNLRAIRAPLTLADFQGDLERINRIGTFGLVGELAGAAFNVGTGQGDNRSLSLDGRVVALQSFQSLKTAFNNLVNQNFDVDYLHVVRPAINAVGAGGLLQYTDIVNKGLGLDNIEARTLQRLNAENYLRVTARDLGMPVKTGGGFSATPTPMAPWVARMELAAYANDPEGFRNSWQGALQTAKDMKKDDPAGYVRRAYEARHPLRYVLGLTPSTTEYRQLIQNMDDTGREAVTGAVRMFNHYGAAIGIPPFEGSERKEKQQRQSVGMIIPRLTPTQLRRNAYSTAMGVGINP